MSGTGLSYSSGRNQCQSEGGDLAVYDIYEKYYNFRKIYYENLGLNQHVWFGLTDHHGLSPAVERKWITGSKLNYNNFSGEPPSSSGSTDDCYFSSAFGDHLWYDDQCYQIRFYSCERGN